jgi:hypothetical protein
MSTQNKSLLLKTFHKQLFDFLDDIISIMPDNHELVKSKVYFTTLKQANPTLIIKIWYKSWKCRIYNVCIYIFFKCN